jgi:hypothetical protein
VKLLIKSKKRLKYDIISNAYAEQKVISVPIYMAESFLLKNFGDIRKFGDIGTFGDMRTKMKFFVHTMKTPRIKHYTKAIK